MNKLLVILLIIGIVCFLAAMNLCEYQRKVETVLDQYPIGHKQLLQAGVKWEDLGDCYIWAFGDDWAGMMFSDTADRFRALHPEVDPPIHDADRFNEAWKRIGKLYLRSKS